MKHTKEKEHEMNLESVSRDAGEMLGKMVSNLTQDTTEILGNTEDYIKKNPTKSLMIAAAAGAVLGSILTLTLTRRR